MTKKCMIIINPDATQGKNAIRYFTQNNIAFTVSAQKGDMNKHFNAGVRNGVRHFIICSGDGGVHNLMQEYMKLPMNKRRLLRFSVLPGGKANDLARELKIPLDIPKAYAVTRKKTTRTLDLIETQGQYVITGGGFGLTQEVMAEIDKASAGRIGRVFNSISKGIIYQLVVYKKLFTGFKGIKRITVNGTEHYDVMLVAVMNQSFHGKKYVMCPEARNNDGILDVGIIANPKGFVERLQTLLGIMKGKNIRAAHYVRGKTISVQTPRLSGFVGDGDVMCTDTNFQFQVIQGAVRFSSNSGSNY